MTLRRDSVAGRRSQAASGRVLLQEVERVQHRRLVRLDDAAVEHHLVQDDVRLLQVEHDVELAHVLEVLVECLHQRVDELEQSQLVRLLVVVGADDEVEGGVAPVLRCRLPRNNDVGSSFLKAR